MPQIPVFDDAVTVRAPGAAHADPSAFAAPGRALAAGAQQFSNEMEAFNERYQAAKRAADAASAVAGVSRSLDDIEYRWSQTPDRDTAVAGYDKEVGEYRKKVLGGIRDPLVGARVAERFDTMAVAGVHSVRNAAFGLETSKRQGDWESHLRQYENGAATATNDAARAIQLDNAQSETAAMVAGGWLKPKEADERLLKFRSNVEDAGISRARNAALNNDNLDESADTLGKLAAAVSDPRQTPNLTAERREAITGQLLTASNRQATRAAAAQARADAQAERNLKRAQTHNLGVLMLRVRNGTLKESDAAAALQSDAISESGYVALTAGIDREDRGRDDPIAAGQLRKGVEDGTATADDINHARAQGLISTATQVAAMTRLGERDRGQRNEIERGAHAVLSTIFSGAAVEQDPFGIDSKKPGTTRLWAQANGEYNQRVFGAKEDPIAVLSDIVPKYSAAIPPSPTWLAPPKFGPVNSLDDVAAVWTKTKAARDTGALDDASFRSQQTLLDNYLTFYREKLERETIHIPFKEPAAKKQAPLR